MPNDLATIMLALGATGGVALLLARLWLVHRTPILLAGAVGALVAAGVLLWIVVPAVVAHCTRGPRHIDCVPDRIEYMLLIVKLVVIRNRRLALLVVASTSLIGLLTVAILRRRFLAS